MDMGSEISNEVEVDNGGRESPRAGARSRRIDVDGNVNIPGLRPRGRARKREAMKCTWREACKGADYVLEHFGDRTRDRGIWVWYCQRIGLDVFLELADEIISCLRQGEIKYPVRAFQRHLMDTLPKEA